MIWLILVIWLSMPKLAYGQYSIEVGKTEKVFDWSENRCEEDDLPDSPARAFVGQDGKIRLFSAHVNLRQFKGDNLDDVKRDCSVLFRSHKNPEIRKYQDYEWIMSPYTEDGNTVWGLVHTEYHGWEHDNCNSANWTDCWWNSVNLVVSTDGGNTYQYAAPVPAHTILNSPVDYSPNNKTGPVGFFEPSNIIKKGNYYFTTVNSRNPPEDQRVCLARTDNLADPTSWRMWNGFSFSATGDRGRCVSPDSDMRHFYIAYNDYLKKYVSLECHWENKGLIVSTSDDLINWSPIQWLFKDGRFCIYCSLLQPGDPTRNFELSSRSPWLYSMQCGNGQCSSGCNGSLDRDLVRTRIRFNLPGDENKYELLDLRFSEKAGNKALDASFYGNNMTIVGKPVWFGDSGREYIYLDTATRGVVEDSSSLDWGEERTVKIMFRLNHLPNGEEVIVGKGKWSIAVLPSGQIRVRLGEKTVDSIKKVRVHYWEEVSFRYIHQQKKVGLAINGVLDLEDTIESTPIFLTDDSQIVVNSAYGSFDLDQLVILNWGETFVRPTSSPVRPTNTPTKVPTPTTKPTNTPTKVPTNVPIKPSATAIPTQKGTNTPTPDVGCKECVGKETKKTGDANCDGKTNILDFSVWRMESVTFGGRSKKSVDWESDFNCDGFSNIFDFSILRQFLN